MSTMGSIRGTAQSIEATVPRRQGRRGLSSALEMLRNVNRTEAKSRKLFNYSDRRVDKHSSLDCAVFLFCVKADLFSGIYHTWHWRGKTAGLSDILGQGQNLRKDDRLYSDTLYLVTTLALPSTSPPAMIK